jgi:hypothetical protein
MVLYPVCLMNPERGASRELARHSEIFFLPMSGRHFEVNGCSLLLPHRPGEGRTAATRPLGGSRVGASGRPASEAMSGSGAGGLN